MAERSPFGVRLWRLMSARRPSATTSIERMLSDLARKAEVPSAELGAVVNGAVPSDEIVRRLGPALGIKTADMFVIAGLPVSIDVASAWPTSPWDVGSIVDYAARLKPEQRSRLSELVRSLPVQPRTEPAESDDYPEGPGALLLRLLKNRNIRPGNALILNVVGGGPYVSHATMAMLGPEKVVLTPQYVTAFAHLLGYAPEDMVALAGVGPAVENSPVHPAHAEIAALAWNARLLDSDQIGYVRKAAKAML